jgi:LasA protease
MNKKWTRLVILILFVLVIACNIPFDRPYTGISPILTATAAARQLAVGEPGQSGIDIENLNLPETQVAYTIQSGDTLPALAARFQVPEANIMDTNHTTIDRAANSTLPPNNALVIELGRKPGWGEPVHIMPDNYFVNGPIQVDFDAEEYIRQSPGWLAKYVDTSGGNRVTGTEILVNTAFNYSISPRVLLAIVEYQLQALSSSTFPTFFSLGSTDVNRKTLGKQLSWAANALNYGYYGWRDGVQISFTDPSGQQITPNPESNASSVAFQYYFSRFLSGEKLQKAMSEEGFLSIYKSLFGEIDWNIENLQPLIPANLRQPELDLPLQSGLKWAYTGGPHSGWGTGYPYAAIDFAPPATTSGCDASPYWVTAAADGVITRSDEGIILQDIESDGHFQTGWVIQYLHLSPGKQLPVGTELHKGDQIGHPSCIGGNSSGRNVHIARLYNGEWIDADGPVPLNLGGWVAINGEKEYKGSLVKGQMTLRSSSAGEHFSQIPVQ